MYALFSCYFDPDQNDETEFLAVADSREKLVSFAVEKFKDKNIVFVDSPISDDYYETVKRLWITELAEDQGLYKLDSPSHALAEPIFIP
jgi:hypothetical protein